MSSSNGLCLLEGCKEPSLKGRWLCNEHAYPAENRKSERRRVIEAQKKRKEQANG